MTEALTIPETVIPETPPPPRSRDAAALVQIGDRGVMLKSLDDLLRFGRLAVEAGAAPKGMSAGAAAMAIQAGLERGLGPLGGLQAAIVINGLLSWRGQAAKALIQNSPACKPGTLRCWTEGEGDTMRGVAVGHRVGFAEADRREFSVLDAKRAGLWGKEGPWKQYPQRQLMWRALGFLARDIFPDVLGGFPLAEEAADYEEQERLERSVTSPADRVAMLPPPKPDPLLDALAGGPTSTPVPVTVSPAEEPGAEESAQAFTDAEEPEVVLVDPKAPPQEEAPGCNHPNCPPSRVADATARGKSIHCPDCGEELASEPPPPELELSAPKQDAKPAQRRTSKRL